MSDAILAPLTRTITFLDRIPSKKNSQGFKKVGSRIIIYPSKEYRAWEAKAIADDLYGIAPIPWESIAAEMTIFAPDKRSADLSNKWESIADCLVKAGILPDDNWFVLDAVTLKFGGVDKKNPRAEVKFWESSNAG